MLKFFLLTLTVVQVEIVHNFVRGSLPRKRFVVLFSIQDNFFHHIQLVNCSKLELRLQERQILIGGVMEDKYVLMSEGQRDVLLILDLCLRPFLRLPP
jgi:hypothetical protein